MLKRECVCGWKVTYADVSANKKTIQTYRHIIWLISYVWASTNFKNASGLKRGRDNTQTEKACRDQSNRKHDHNTKYMNKQLVNNDPTSTLIMKILNLEP